MSLGLEPAQQQLAVIGNTQADGSRRATLAYSPVGGTAEASTSDPPPSDDGDAIEDGDIG